MDTSVQAPIKKKAYHHGDLRNAIIIQAVGRARSIGERAIILREIAGEIGVSATAAYRHFTNRAQLVDEVAIKGYEACLEAVSLAPVTDGGAEPTGERLGLAAYLDLRNVSRALLEFAAAERPWTRLMLDSLGSSDSVREAAAAVNEHLQGVLARGAESGLIVSDYDFGQDRVFWAGIDGLGALLIHSVAPGTTVDEALGDAAGRMIELCTSHLLTDAGRAAIAAAGPLPTGIVNDLGEWA